MNRYGLEFKEIPFMDADEGIQIKFQRYKKCAKTYIAGADSSMGLLRETWSHIAPRNRN